MLDDDEGVAEVAQALEGRDEALVVALVQADGGLVEDVEHAHESRADLGGQADALRLAAGEGAGRAGEGEVVQAHVEQEAQAGADLPQHLVGDRGLPHPELEALVEGERVADRHLADLGDGLPADGHGEHLGAQARALARGAGHLAHELLVALLGPVGLGVAVATLEEVHDALEARGVGALAAEAVAVLHVDLEVLAVQQRLLRALGQRAPGGVHREGELLGEAGHDLLVVVGGAHGPRGDRAVCEGEVLVGDHQLGIDLEPLPQARALGAGAVGGVEGEGARLDVVDREGVVVRAGALLGEAAGALRVLVVAVHVVDQQDPLGQPQGGLDRVGEATARVGLRREAVDDHLDRVLVALVEADLLVQAAVVPVDAGAGVALGAQGAEQVLVLPLAPLHHGCQQLEAGAGLLLEEGVHDLLGRGGGDQLAADGAVLLAGAGEQQAQVVVDLGDRADGGARVAVGGLLVDRDRRGEPLDEVDAGLVHLPEELPRIAGERLDVAPLPLGEDGVEGQGALAGAGQAGEHHQLVAGDVDVDVLEVVLARTTDDQGISHPGILGAHTDLRTVVRGR